VEFFGVSSRKSPRHVWSLGCKQMKEMSQNVSEMQSLMLLWLTRVTTDIVRH
jgi:hypothetical protein